MRFPSVRAEMSTKQKILWLLRRKPMRPSEIAKVLRLRRATVSGHLRDLKRRRLVRWSGTWKKRYYCVRDNLRFSPTPAFPTHKQKKRRQHEDG